MKICIISVAPMPSRIVSPVVSCHASNVAFGSPSPAETHLRSEEMSCSASLPSIARYAVGAVNQIGPADVNIDGPEPTNIHYHGMDVSPSLEPPGDNVFTSAPSQAPVPVAV